MNPEVSLVTAAARAAGAGGGPGWGGRSFSLADEAETSGDHTTHSDPRFGMASERRFLHALPDLKCLHRIAWFARNRFVEISGHRNDYFPDGPEIKTITDEFSGSQNSMLARFSRSGRFQTLCHARL